MSSINDGCIKAVPIADRRWLSISDLSLMLGCSYNLASEIARDSRAVKRFNRRVFVDRNAIDEFLEKQED